MGGARVNPPSGSNQQGRSPALESGAADLSGLLSDFRRPGFSLEGWSGEHHTRVQQRAH
jgi:hypothetical protein